MKLGFSPRSEDDVKRAKAGGAPMQGSSAVGTFWNNRVVPRAFKYRYYTRDMKPVAEDRKVHLFVTTSGEHRISQLGTALIVAGPTLFVLSVLL